MMSTNTTYVHLLGDLDTYYGILNDQGSNAKYAEANSVEGQLQTQLTQLEQVQERSYKVFSHAYKGFDTVSVLNGGEVESSTTVGKHNAYLKHKGIDPSNSSRVYPLGNLYQAVSREGRNYVILSIGKNDFGAWLSPYTLPKEMHNIHQRYFKILDELEKISEKTEAEIRPILVFQYHTKAKNYLFIYKVMKVVGVAFAVVNMICMIGLAISMVVLATGKINRVAGGILGLFSAAVLYASSCAMPLKVTKGILSGQSIGVATLGGLMERFYHPILLEAQKRKIPVLDLSNIFNPFQEDLYISGVEPSEKGSALIAECIRKVLIGEERDPNGYVIYSKKLNSGDDDRLIGYIDFPPDDWKVHCPSSK